MKFIFKVLVSSFIICITTQTSYAQFETSKKKKILITAMPQISSKKRAIVKVEKPKQTIESSIEFKPNQTPDDQDKVFKKYLNTPQVSFKPFDKPNDVRNPSELYTEKMNKKGTGESNQQFMSDTYLGEFKTSTRSVRIACRDHEAPDGDMVRIWVNDKIAVESITLDVAYKELHLELVSGFNKIEFEALNQGTSGPNTAEFVVFDDKGKPITTNKWNLATGTKAKVILVKEEVER